MSQRIGRTFMRQTRYQFLEPSDQFRGVPPPPLEDPPDPSRPRVDLPEPATVEVDDVLLREAIEQRESVRRYELTALSLDELSFLLFSTQGVKEVISQAATLRTVPSAGARHALETYLLINRVSPLEPGLYRYLPLEHQLQVESVDPDMAEKVTHACLGQQFVRNAAVTFIWVANTYRMTWRYSERGYRYLLLDAGHVCQNLYLAAEAISAGVCAIAAFQDEELDRVLNLDSETHFALYVATVGRRMVPRL